jgi:hypothetical protein
MASLGDAKNLGHFLKERREESKYTSNKITGHKVATAIRQSQTQVWKVENGQVDVTKWFPERQLALLQAYNLDNNEIVETAEKFNLELPDVKNATNPNVINLKGVRLVTLRIVGHSGAGEPLTVLESDLKGYRAESCVAVLTSGSTLACERVRDEYKAAASLIFSSEKKPEPGKVVLYRFKETDDYLICIYRETPHTFPAISYDGTRAMTLAHDDPRLEFCGTQFSGTIDERFVNERQNN